MTLPTREETMEAWGSLLQRIPPKWVDDITVLDALVSARHCGLLQTREEWAAPIRQLVFDIIMHERNLDESDMDDQAEASEQADEWTALLDAALGGDDEGLPTMGGHSEGG